MASSIKGINTTPIAERTPYYEQELGDEIDKLDICVKTSQTSILAVKTTSAIKANNQFIYRFHKEQPSALSDLGVIEKRETVPHYTRELNVKESSLLRRIHVFVCSLFHDMWSSLGSSIGARLPLSLRTRLEDINTEYVDEQVRKLPDLGNGSVNSTIQSLRVQTEFNSIGVDTYCKFLSEKPDVQYISNCLVKEGIETEVEKFPEATANNLLIPVVLKGFGRDHIVCFYIKRNPDDGTMVIEFYDSKGLTIADRANETLVNNPDMTLAKLVAQLADRYCDDVDDHVRIEENTTKHQQDSHNCGIYVCHYFSERIAGTPAETIQANQYMGYAHTFTWRANMIHDLMDDFRFNISDAQAAQRAASDPLMQLPDDEEEDDTPAVNQLPTPPLADGEFVDIPL
jgi:hypothetical protein